MELGFNGDGRRGVFATRDVAAWEPVWDVPPTAVLNLGLGTDQALVRRTTAVPVVSQGAAHHAAMEVQGMRAWQVCGSGRPFYCLALPCPPC